MDRAVDGGKAPAQPVQKETPPPAKPTAPPHAFSAAPDFNGVWVYESRQGAWTGFGEPVRAALSVHHNGASVAGSYTALLPGKNDVRELNLTISGEETTPGTAYLSWVSKWPPATGKMILRMGGDRRILVERIASDDTYIPRGMEVLLPR